MPLLLEQMLEVTFILKRSVHPVYTFVKFYLSKLYNILCNALV